MRFLILSILIVIFICGCSGGSNPVNPDEMTVKKTARENERSPHASWGLWQGSINPDERTLEFVQLRSGGFHMNVLPFLEPPPFVNLTLESLEINGNVVEADIGLKHPFFGLDEFTGFDVCGILITNGTAAGFSDSTLRMAGVGDTRLLNPDGLSRWWNPAEFPVNSGTIFSYQDGLLGTQDSIAHFNCTLNGYKYFCDDLGPDDPLSDATLEKRGMFSAGRKNIRHYTIEMGTGLIFNYAVDACWAFPAGSPPWVAPDDFPQQANRPEAWRIEVAEVVNTLWNDGGGSGGDILLSIKVYDWYGGDLNMVKVESPNNFAPVISETPTGSGEGFHTFELEISGATPAQESIDLLISVESDNVGYGGLLPGKSVTSYFTYSAPVAAESPSPGWARTWGGTETDRGFGTAVDGSGNIYVSGAFRGVADFNPGTEIDEHTSNGGEDVFLTKFNSYGDFQWARTWGGIYYDQGRAVAVDDSGNVYVAGPFEGAVDFDPGDGTDNHSSVDASDVFLSKFNSTGAFQWARTWGGTWPDSGRGVGVDASGNIYVSGYFRDTVNFDPGGGSEIHSSNGNNDVFLSKFDSSGSFQWARTWGGTGNDQNRGLAVDDSGNSYVTGFFADSVDFDPGGTDIHNSNGAGDIFVSKFNTSGTFQWARTWGGILYDEGWAVAVGGSGAVYVTGWFADIVDFDPGTVTENHTSNGVDDAFLSKLNASGTFQWARTWGGWSFDYGYGVAVDNYGNISVAGKFWDEVDFDPGLATDNRTSNGLNDVYLSKFDSSGDYLWANTWGGSANDEGHGVALGNAGNIHVTGLFSGIVDFAPPGAGQDEHTSSGNSDAFVCKFLSDGNW